MIESPEDSSPRGIGLRLGGAPIESCLEHRQRSITMCRRLVDIGSWNQMTHDIAAVE